MQKPAVNGFSLIELVVAIAVIAILVSVALPSYNEYVLRGRLTSATQGLADVKVQMERFYASVRNYGTGGVCTGAAPAPTVEHFSFTCASGAATFTWTATGSGPATGFAYTINQTGEKNTTSLPASWGAFPVLGRWVTKRGG